VLCGVEASETSPSYYRLIDRRSFIIIIYSEQFSLPRNPDTTTKSLRHERDNRR